MRRGVLAAAASLLVLGGCSGGLQVDTYPTEDGTELDCRSMLADTPQAVGGRAARRVADDVAAAWGDPPIVLRCGVEDPAALTPASRCDMVADVGWFTEEVAGGFLFTTIGRRFNVSVEVPDDYAPEADVLVDVADVVQKHVPVEQPCV